MKDKVYIHNSELFNKLIKQCDIKSINKNYKGQIVKRIWIPKTGTNKYRPFDIPTIRDRVLQQCVLLSINPIVEYQSDSHSFGFRTGRSAHDAVSKIIYQLGILTPNQSNNIKVVDKYTFNNFQGRKHRAIKKKELDLGKRKRKYAYKYYILPHTNDQNKEKQYKYTLNRVLNVDIVSFFDEVSHASILKYIPITQKYLFFIKSWLAAPIYGDLLYDNTKHRKHIPSKGVPQGSIIGPMICNVVLDGLQKYLLDDIGSKYFDNYDNVQSRKDNRYTTSISFFRFADEIIVLGNGSDSQFDTILSRLVCFLEERGLTINNGNDLLLFKPGSSFEYLGFKFIYTDSNSNIIDRGKYTKYDKNNILQSLRCNHKRFNRSGLLVIIRDKSFKKIKQNIKNILSNSNTVLDIGVIIDRMNSFIRVTVNYFGITSTTRNQLKILDYYIYKRFLKLLLRKYGSTPKLKSYVMSKFYNKSRSTFHYNNNTLLKTTDIKPYGNSTITNIAKSDIELYYLDSNHISNY